MNIYSAVLRKTILPLLLQRDDRESSLKHWRFLNESQYWTKSQLQDYQWRKLKKLLEYSYENCEFYREVFDERNLTPDSIKSFEDMQLLPVLDRGTIYKNVDRMISRRFSKDQLAEFYTGGTTGQQSRMYRDQESYNIKLGAQWRFENWLGRYPCDKYALFWTAGIDYVTSENARSKFKNRYLLREIIYKAGSAKEEAMKSFYDGFSKFKAEYLKVFPASFYGFVEYLEDNNLPLHRVKGILCTGEPLYEHQRNKFENHFNCPVYDMYASREVGNSACECQKHEGLHISMETNFVEFVDDDNRPVDYNQEGEILITDLTNYGMPLLRYKINDRGKPLAESCSCGRGLQLMSPAVGRVQDDIYSPDGTRHSGFVLGYHFTMGKAISGIELGQAQFIQESLTHFHVNLTDDPEPTSETFNYIEKEMKKILGDSIEVTFSVLDKIPLEKSGKIRFVKSEIDPPE